MGDWKDAFVASYKEANDDNLAIVAAGVGFYSFLSLVPLLASVVLIYGLVVDSETVARHVSSMSSMLPGSATELVRTQLESIVSGPDSSKGFGLVVALGLALFSARNAAGAVIIALNIAYDVEDDRSFFKRVLLALAITIGGILGAGLVLGATTAITMLGSLMPDLGGGTQIALKIGTYVLLFLLGMAAAATLYRFGPNRAEPRWKWVTPGSFFAAAGWLLVTIGFGIYVNNFGNYDATYGTLGAVVVLMTWMWLSAYVLLFGAELNDAVRKQAKEDDETAS
ncbi:YihY/virulence factor BrkB family protein [Altericroceibacterium xinjiangense]|uniref:YihY/virulence factor BrkB family protein n=1 Tax=Altericroceibacterium xinjiangense TaxID=762261 RepID=UPI001F498CE3|nr:YihY/virulence factor BrkB family protein [Altericroceibacterium xinjiangense]